MSNDLLTVDERDSFTAIADILIPAAEGMPAFSEVTVQAELTDRVLELRPELLPDLQRALKKASGMTAAEAAEHLNKEDPQAFGTLGLVASSAYYLDQGVRQRLGYPGQLSRPASPSEEADYMDDNLLQPVIDRGKIYRDTPD